MARLFSNIACCLAALGCMPAAQAAPAANIEQEVARLEKDCNDAYAANNLPKYFSYYADDAVLIFANTRTTVPAYRKMWTEEIKTKPLESVKLSDMVIRVTPSTDTAIASYQIEIRTHQPSGTTTDERYFETDVWVRKGDAWKLSHVHFSPLRPT
ncbi:MAG: nuclear transport factor 2 family protein [Proteobacteria bacterium]|nr:nuclear transport factor 2 family protein [Pseudomonadota bacterium]